MQVNINTSTKVALLFCGALMSGSVFAENIIPKGASRLPSLEFGALVKTYMIDSNSKSTWNFSTNSQNILWDSGVNWNSQTKEYQKDGFTRLQFNGFKLKKLTDNNLQKMQPETAWDIIYWSRDKTRVNRISVYTGFISENDEPKVNPFSSLIKLNITYRPFCFDNLGGGSQSIGYRLTTPNKKALYMIISDSSGSGGYLQYYDLFLTKNDMVNYFYDSMHPYIPNRKDRTQDRLKCLTVLF